jgi:hypothetical protein
MATKGKILSYVDNVVSSYDSLEQEARFPNLAIDNTADVQNLNVVDTNITNQLRIGDVTTGYTFPSSRPSNAAGYYLSMNNAGNFEFKNFSTESLSTDDIAGITLDGANDGDIVHFSNGSITTELTSQITVIDNRPPLDGRFLSNSDRLLISSDAGVGTKLYRIEIKDLLQGLEFLQTSVSVVGSLTSNTKMAAGADNFTYIIDKNNILTTIAEIDIDGLALNGNIKLTDTSILSFGNTSDAFIDTSPAEGYIFSRNGNTVTFSFNGTENLTITDNQIEVGSNLILDNGAYLTLNGGGFYNSTDRTLELRANCVIDQNLRSTNTDSVRFYNLQASDFMRVGQPTGYRLDIKPEATFLEIDAYDDNDQRTPILSNTVISILSSEAATNSGLGAFRVVGGIYSGANIYAGGGIDAVGIISSALEISSDYNIIAGDTLQGFDLSVANNSVLGTVEAETLNANNIIITNIQVTEDINVANSVFAIDFIQSSSIEYKENIQSFENGLDYIINMNPVIYDRKDNNSKNNIGFIAEDMQKILPNVVTTLGDKTGIKYTEIIPVLVSALKEQQNKISELESKINN